MSVEIWKVRVRDALVPRREPYWGTPCPPFMLPTPLAR